MKKYILTLFCCTALSGIHAQETKTTDALYQPYSPVGLPVGAPAWMAELENIDTLNYYRMIDRFIKFQQDNPSMQTKTPLNKPVLNYFYRWQKAYAPFVRPDGRIVVPRQTDYVAKVDEINAVAASAKPATRAQGHAALEPWKVITPINTYHVDTKKVRAWQTNVQRFDVSPQNPNIIYAGTETGLVFKSVDKGLRWNVCAANHFFGGPVNSIEISRNNSNKVVVSSGSLVWMTTDGGTKWENITPAAFRNVFTRVHDVVIHPVDDNILLMANDRGIYKSADNGKNWKQVDSGRCFDMKYKPGDPNVLYSLITKDGTMVFCKSTNGGESFERHSLGDVSPLASGRIGVSSAPQGENYIYILACKLEGTNSFKIPFFSGSPVLFKSKDGGNQWTANENIGSQMESFDKWGGQGFYDLVVQPSPKDPETILFGLLNLYRSTNGGETITNVGGYYGKFDLHCDMQDLKVVGEETWLSTDGGIILSNDFFDNHAEPRINGIYASEFWGFDMGWNEDVMAGGRNHNGNMVQLDRYKDAAISVGGSEVSTGYVFLSNPRKVAFSDYGSCYLPDDWKEQFTPFTNYETFPLENATYGIGFEYDPRYAKSFYINRREEPKSLWKTVNDGESFVQLYTFSENVSGYAVSRVNPDVILVGTVGHIYRSEDGGKSFVLLADVPEEMRNSANYKIAIHPRNDQEFWVITHELGGLFRTRNGGTTWEKMDQNLQLPATGEKQMVSRIILTGNDKNAVYAVAGVMRTLDETYSVYRHRILYRDDTTNGWQDFSEGLPPVMTITRMLPFYKEGQIRIATNNGVWQRPLVDSDFRPVAQPIVLSAGTGENKSEEEWQFDSYSIVNQNHATWEWKFVPEPIYISDKHVRNPKVRLAADQSYDVTLTVTTPKGTDTKTVKNMIRGKKDVPTSIQGLEVLDRDVDFDRLSAASGESFRLFPRGLSQELRLTLYDAGGKVVRTLVLTPNVWQELSTSGLASGVYFYVCQSAEFKKSGRLVLR